MAILVPGVDPTRLVNWTSYECFTKPYTGTFYVGPYVMRGTLMGFPNGIFDENLVAVDVHISTPEGPASAEIDAPFAVVSFREVLGWEVE